MVYLLLNQTNISQAERNHCALRYLIIWTGCVLDFQCIMGTTVLNYPGNIMYPLNGEHGNKFRHASSHLNRCSCEALPVLVIQAWIFRYMTFCLLWLWLVLDFGWGGLILWPPVWILIAIFRSPLWALESWTFYPYRWRNSTWDIAQTMKYILLEGKRSLSLQYTHMRTGTHTFLVTNPWQAMLRKRNHWKKKPTGVNTIAGFWCFFFFLP